MGSCIINKSWMAIIVAGIFCVYKLLEAKYLEDKKTPMKYVIRDTVVVYVCVWIGSIVLEYSEGDINEFVGAITDGKNSVLETMVENVATSAPIFTDEPAF